MKYRVGDYETDIFRMEIFVWNIANGPANTIMVQSVNLPHSSWTRLGLSKQLTERISHENNFIAKL